MSVTESSQNAPEESAPGIPGGGFLFDAQAGDAGDGQHDGQPGEDESMGGHEDGLDSADAVDPLSPDGAALAGLDPETLDKLLAKVAVRRYTKRLEEAVDAHLDQLDWTKAADGVEAKVAAHVAEAAGVDLETGELPGNQDETGTQAAGGNASAPEATADAPQPEASAVPQYKTVYEFYDDLYGPLYEYFDVDPGVMAQRGHQSVKWCRQWWNHESVVTRMVALWMGYEAAHTEGGGAVSTWILDHADRHFDRIMAEDGSLSKCTEDHALDMQRYPTDPVPEAANLDAAALVSEATGSVQGISGGRDGALNEAKPS